MQMIIDFSVNNHVFFLIGLLVVTVSIRIVFIRNLLEAVIIMSLFSLLVSISYLLMDGADVAMTEIALGSCLSTCVYLAFLKKIPRAARDRIIRGRIIVASILSVIFVLMLLYIGLELPCYGDINAPLQSHLSRYYLENTNPDIGIPSVVAAILASYRGYDTLGEAAVILLAGVSVLLIFSKKDGDASK